MENYEDIFYLHCPHFTNGPVDQWGEQGFLLHEGEVYSYEEDRKDQCGRTFGRTSIRDFLVRAEQEGLTIPSEFMTKLYEASILNDPTIFEDLPVQ